MLMPASVRSSSTSFTASGSRRTGRARDVLVEHHDDLELLSQVLLRRETIDREEFIGLLAGEPEEVVFAARDAKAARAAAQIERSAGTGTAKPKRLPYPSAGEPLPEG